jgi:hypothetical protein
LHLIVLGPVDFSVLQRLASALRADTGRSWDEIFSRVCWLAMGIVVDGGGNDLLLSFGFHHSPAL